jgi:hypothetical protein
MMQRTNRIIVKPAKRWFSTRQQWTFELRAANGERIDPRDTVYNQPPLISTLVGFFDGDTPLELVVQDRYGNIDYRTPLR